MPDWYAFRTPPMKEFVAEEVLNRRGHDAFVPVEWKWRRGPPPRRIRQRVKCPMLVRYVFVGFGARPPWYDLSKSPVIQGVVGLDGAPARIAQESIDYLRRLSGTHVPHMRSYNPRRSFSPGDEAQITGGPFAGIGGLPSVEALP